MDEILVALIPLRRRVPFLLGGVVSLKDRHGELKRGGVNGSQ
jgi:hypothetical protein